MAQSMWCRALLDWWFEWIFWWCGCVILVWICLNLLSWYDPLNNVYWIHCLCGINLCWSLLIFMCWWLCEIIWWSYLCYLQYNFLLWGRWSWMTLYLWKALHSYKKYMYSSMLLWCSNIYVGRGILGNVLYGFLRHFIPPCGSGLAVPYMWLYTTEYYVLSGKLRIIPLCRNVLKLDVPGQ